ncbi:hypothetical protein NP493_783g01041 [Ridgeia piscesae]|uniref:Mitochondrial inner membrane protein Mpv17 n=1 Tax=Ridgeia piscesae TaxID=27915 RepID=A0AAD9KNR9_RIDPI|nr:hypothetical protein NP493_783g01041 [Ridgeia piscesae]
MPVRPLWKRYVHLLERYPARTHAANTCVLMGGGDVIAQLGFEKRSSDRYDFYRTARFLGVGFVLAGPGMHLWYSCLDRFIKGTRNAKVLKKTLADQILFLPFYLGSFISVMTLLRREPLSHVGDKLQRDFKPMLFASYELWPAVQLVNFYLVPLRHQVLVMNVVGLAWNSYVSWKAEK